MMREKIVKGFLIFSRKLEKKKKEISVVFFYLSLRRVFCIFILRENMFDRSLHQRIVRLTAIGLLKRFGVCTTQAAKGKKLDMGKHAGVSHRCDCVSASSPRPPRNMQA